MADLRRDWVRYCAGGGAATVLLFGWFMMTADKPWREQEKGLAPGKWVQVSITGRRETHWVTYEYEAEGGRHRGEYRCQGCMGWMRETARPGAPMSVEYRRDNPAVSRPVGLVTGGRSRYHRVGLAAGFALLAAAALGVVVGPGWRRGD